ncbi:MAG: hypothetical protein V4654_10145 [Bdellovibrionota bacterium]
MKSKKIIIVLAAALVAFTQTSCLKKQNLEDANLGPAVDADVVEAKMAEGIGGLDPADINRNESSNISAVTTYEDSQSVKLFSQSIIVNSIADLVVSGATVTRFALDYSKVDYLNSNQSFNNFTYNLDFGHSNDAVEAQSTKQRSELTAKNADKVPFFMYRAFIVMAAFACREAKVTCHNLTVEDSQMSLSPDLADPRICSDTLKCKIPIRKVEYDLVDNGDIQTDGQPSRTHYTFLMSSSLPFFSKVLQYCVRGLVDMETRKVLAEDCLSINGFSVGD